MQGQVKALQTAGYTWETGSQCTCPGLDVCPERTQEDH